MNILFYRQHCLIIHLYLIVSGGANGLENLKKKIFKHMIFIVYISQLRYTSNTIFKNYNTVYLNPPSYNIVVKNLI